MSIGGFASPVLAATPFMQPAGDTAPPIGHVQYCQENTADCERTFKTAPSVALTISGWRELNDINYTVNTLIQPVTDQEQYQRPEHWTIPTFMGDCEDYVLLKRHMLHKAGWPLNALLITVVRDEKGDGHAVLTVRTDRGDLILDNQAEHIVTWDHTPYRYVKRQSEHHAGQWTAIRDIRPMAGQKVARR
ncbi:MAG: transglutaminase-like cysteine peptidase [Pseudomonadota bacterium]